MFCFLEANVSMSLSGLPCLSLATLFCWPCPLQDHLVMPNPSIFSLGFPREKESNASKNSHPYSMHFFYFYCIKKVDIFSTTLLFDLIRFWRFLSSSIFIFSARQAMQLLVMIRLQSNFKWIILPIYLNSKDRKMFRKIVPYFF